jgi:hypothetical protein
MPHAGDKIHIPLETDEALRLALKVKPTRICRDQEPAEKRRPL